jgi:2,3-bisphosphoglycerate-independent phosphoglycerate mutase
MDGIGLKPARFGNAVALAKTPSLKKLESESLFTTLTAHGTAVGLPSDDDIGNSEVGHNALGAGRIFNQGAKLVGQAIADGSLFKGQAWRDVVAAVKKSHGTLHLLGLLSDGGVHSNQEHLFALLRGAKRDGVGKARIHVLFDGRDVGEKSAEKYVDRLEQVMSELRDPGFDVQVASGGGRMHITMDRYGADWPMVERGWRTHVRGEAQQFPSLPAALAAFRALDPAPTDQYLPAFVVAKDGVPVGRIEDGDAVVLFNFRGDRAIEISRAFTEADFHEFARGPLPKVTYAGMMEYDGDLHIPPRYLVAPPAIDNTLSEYLLKNGARQFACSETQKFGHVTFFWNGNRSGYLDKTKEEYVEVASDGGITFDMKPKMKAPEITDVTIDRMRRGTFDFGRINYANGDMVGHTGNLPAAIAAVECVDHEVGRLMAAARETGTTLIITADHGNADEMFDAKEKDYPDWESHPERKIRPKTSHTLSPVPCYIYGDRAAHFHLAKLERRTLANVANTVIDLMGLPRHPEYLPSLVEPERP